MNTHPSFTHPWVGRKAQIRIGLVTITQVYEATNPHRGRLCSVTVDRNAGSSPIVRWVKEEDLIDE